MLNILFRPIDHVGLLKLTHKCVLQLSEDDMCFEESNIIIYLKKDLETIHGETQLFSNNI